MNIQANRDVRVGKIDNKYATITSHTTPTTTNKDSHDQINTSSSSGSPVTNFRSRVEGGVSTSYSSQPTPPPSSQKVATEFRHDAKPLNEPSSPAASAVLSPVDKSLPLKRKGNLNPAAAMLAFVLNIFSYDIDPDTKTDISRQGSDGDEDRCVNTFTRFDVGVFVPPVTKTTRILHEDISRWIEEFKSHCIEGQTRACFIVVMGHGDKPGLLGDSSHRYREIQDIIFTPFDNHNCPQLIGQPKLFFMNCCRGDTVARPVYFTDTPARLMTDSGVLAKTCAAVSDMLIFWATTPGNYALRDVDVGSIFISRLFTKFNNYATFLAQNVDQGEPVEIREILQEVTDDIHMVVYNVTNERNENEEHTQTPNIDQRKFDKFYWKLGDCHYAKPKKLPF